MLNHRTKLTQAIDAAREELTSKGAFTAADAAQLAIETLAAEWNPIRDALALATATSIAQRRITSAIRATDPRQGWLDFPGYERIPQLIELANGQFIEIEDATLEQYRESKAVIAARIESYKYPRRAEKRQKRDQDMYRQMHKLEKHVMGYFAGDTAMRMGKATRLYFATQETPRAKRNRKGGKARQGFTENQ